MSNATFSVGDTIHAIPAETDTVAAIATAPGEGGVAIVRVSGPDAPRILSEAFRSGKRPIDPDKIPDHLMRYGHVLDASGNAIDEAMAVLFRAPRSYTAENVAEFHVHGGRLCAERTLARVLELGARIAEPGEFTRRAFENGRIDLTQAEAVMDTIRADAELAQRAAQAQLSGALRKMIEAFQERLSMLLAKIDAAADYPDEDLDEETRVSCVNEFSALSDEIDALLSSAQDARHIRDGVATAIFGAPNAGKSSLLNLLVGSDRAIVTDIPGTTRDTLEERLVLNGLLFRLIDTAGLRDAADAVEQIGVDRARAAIDAADLLIFVVDAADRTSFDQKMLQDLPKSKPLIVLLNKSDLPAAVEKSEILSLAPQAVVLSIAAKTGEGAQDVQNALLAAALSETRRGDGQLLLGNARHVQSLKLAKAAIDRGRTSAQDGLPVDLLGVDVQEAWQALGAITGQTCQEDVIDKIFENFCVGK